MADSQIVRIGTRGSPLALYQARWVATTLESVSNGDLTPEI
ncbi:MAG: hydroxymethylbilane synthase, partial [Pseudomonadota bacterium]